MITEMEECDVPSCSPCMYGDGNGKLAPYKHKLPVYNGTITETYHKYARAYFFYSSTNHVDLSTNLVDSSTNVVDSSTTLVDSSTNSFTLARKSR